MAQSFDSLTAAQIAAGVAAGDFTATDPSGCVAKPVENISGNTMRSVGPRCSIS